jgi:hypothetical protein
MPASRNTRLTIALVCVLALVVAAAIGGRAIWNAFKTTFSSSSCTVGSYELDTSQASVAAQMVGAASKRFQPALPLHASVLALMAGLQESKLTNIPAGQGDRDSVGVLQQRPSQGWGHYRANPLTDVTEATSEFLSHLVKVPHWRTKAPAAAIQAVQISADGSAYAKHEDEATALARAFAGRRAAGVSCSIEKPTKVASTSRVIGLLRHQLPVNRPSASGRTIRVPGAGWQTTAWFVANADRLGIDSVGYRGKTWTRSDGWKTSSAGSKAVVATMANI